MQRQPLAGERQLARITGRLEVAGIAARDVAERHLELGAMAGRAPARQARAVVHRWRQPILVEGRDTGFAYEQVALAQPRFSLEHRAQHGAVVRQEARLVRFEADLIGRERLCDEEAPRRYRLDAPVIQAPLVGQRQTE